MKKILLVAAVLGAFTSCGQLSETLVNRAYPDGVPLAAMGLPLNPDDTADGPVTYVQFDVFEGVDAVMHPIMKDWSTPQFLGDAVYVSRGGSVTRLDVYVRPDLEGCTPVQTPGVPAFECPPAGEVGNRLGSIEVTGSLQTWGPLGSASLRQAVQVKKGYVGFKVISGRAAKGDELRATVKIKPG